MKDLREVEYKFGNFTLSIYKNHGDTFIYVICELDGKTLERVYEIGPTIYKVEIKDEYVYLTYTGDSQYVIKFEAESCLVIDTFTSSGEHIDCIGCHDFWDEV